MTRYWLVTSPNPVAHSAADIIYCPPRPADGSAKSSSSVHGLVRPAVSARIVLISEASTGVAALPHERLM
jgi:hypothetical protein